MATCSAYQSPEDSTIYLDGRAVIENRRLIRAAADIVMRRQVAARWRHSDRCVASTVQAAETGHLPHSLLRKMQAKQNMLVMLDLIFPFLP